MLLGKPDCELGFSPVWSVWYMCVCLYICLCVCVYFPNNEEVFHFFSLTDQPHSHLLLLTCLFFLQFKEKSINHDFFLIYDSMASQLCFSLCFTINNCEIFSFIQKMFIEYLLILALGIHSGKTDKAFEHFLSE